MIQLLHYLTLAILVASGMYIITILALSTPLGKLINPVSEV